MAQMSDRELERDETVSLISSEKVRGTDVYGADNEKIGHVDHVMIDKRSGRVSYAVMSFGGFLGLGESLHPLPWETLTYDESVDGYRVSLTRAQLEGGPQAESDDSRWADRDYRSGIYDHYGVTPVYYGV